MAKWKGNINSSDGSAPAQPWSLRSRKRERPRDEIPQTEGVQASLHQQDTKENNTTVVDTLPPHPQAPLQECAVITDHQDQSSLTKHDDSREEKRVEETNVTAKAFEGQEDSTLTSPNNESEPESFRVHTDNDANNSGMFIRSPSQTGSVQPQVFLPTSEEGDENQLGEKDNDECNLERNLENSQGELCNVCISDVKEIRKEAAVGLPAKKKRRMGMCGLTERERSHFLQTQKRENGQNGAERVEKQSYNSSTIDLVAQEEIISSLLFPSSPLSFPVHRITEQSEAEIKPQCSRCGGDDRAETEVAVTSSDEAGVCDPVCSEGKSCEAEGGTESGPEPCGEPKSDPPAQVEAGERLGNREQWELEGNTAEIMTEPLEKQREDGEDRPTDVGCGPAIFYTSPTQKEEPGKKQHGSETASMQAHRATQTRVEREEEVMTDAGDGDEAEGTSSTVTGPGGCNSGSVELCEAAVTPSGSERKQSCDPDDEPGHSTLNTERTQTRDTTDPFGSGCLDYVSDSQLNTIVLLEEAMEREGGPGSSDRHEDATDLICGLIRELSSLNRKVMATHRELENLRRGSKSSRSSSR